MINGKGQLEDTKVTMEKLWEGLKPFPYQTVMCYWFGREVSIRLEEYYIAIDMRITHLGGQKYGIRKMFSLSDIYCTKHQRILDEVLRELEHDMLESLGYYKCHYE